MIADYSSKIKIAISHSISESWSDKCRGVGNFATELVAIATSLEILKKNFTSIIYTQNAFIWCKNCKHRTWFVFCLRHKIGSHGNVPCGIGKSGPDQENSRKYLPFGEKIVKIGLIDIEIALLLVKKINKEEEITEGKIYSPVGKFTERAK